MTVKSTNQYADARREPRTAYKYPWPASARQARPGFRTGDRTQRGCVAPGVRPPMDPQNLLDLDSRTRLFKLLLEFGRLVLVDAFLDRLGCGLDQVLGLLEAEPRDRAHL